MWIKEDGFVLAIEHEPLSFLRRAGYASVKQEQHFLGLHSEETVKKLAENGCDFVRMHFYKGSGYEAETEERLMTKDFVEKCHRHGVRVQLYVQFGTISGETMLKEQPGMTDWVQKDADGRPVTLVYGHQSFRYYPCFSSPGYWDYLEKILEDGILNYHADAIGLDNITTGEEPAVCQCDNCKKAFISYLKDRYKPHTHEGAKLCKERFGHTVLDYITPPVWNYYDNHFNLTEIKSPVIQEWILFRCENITRIINRIYNFCKGLNPDILIEINAYKRFGVNTSFINGLYLPDLKGGMDAFWNECDPQPEYTKDGCLYHKIRGYKIGYALGKAVFTGHAGGADIKGNILGYAESMAFNYGIINGLGGIYSIAKGVNTCHRKYKRFRKVNMDIFLSRPMSNVAVYESRASLSFSNFDSYYSDMVMQELLLTRHIQYDIILDLENIGDYKVIILPNSHCLSDNEIDTIKSFVGDGGALVLTDSAGDYDQWHRDREDLALKSQLNISLRCDKPVLKHHYGKGRVVYVPKLENDAPFHAEDFYLNPFKGGYLSVGDRSWKPPFHADYIADAIEWASFGSLPAEIAAPEFVVAQVVKNDREDKVYVHLLNYNTGKRAEKVYVKLNEGHYGNASLLDPENGEARELVFDAEGYVAVEGLDIYLIVCFENK